MVTFAQLESLQPREFEQAADGWREVSSAAAAAADRLNHQIIAGLRGRMDGEAVKAALARLKRLSENFHYTRTECGLVHAALNDLARDLSGAKRKLLDAVGDADDAGFTVQGDGSLAWTATSEEEHARKRKESQQYAARIGQAIREATEADHAWSRVLSGLKARNDLDLTSGDWADTRADRGAVRGALGGDLPRSDIPHNKSVRDNAFWWHHLSPDQQAAYLALYPKAIGALDGLPAVVRDDANRAVMAAQEGALRAELAAMQEPPKYPPHSRHEIPTEEWKQWHERKAHLNDVLHGIEEIQKRFHDTGETGLPPAYLLGFDPAHDGRAIIANGNPDTADHTAVFVFGTSAGFHRIGADMNRAEALWQSSAAMAPGNQQVSTITWVGYDAPDRMVNAIAEHYAEDGAPALGRFLDGLDTRGTPYCTGSGHVTVVAHSYATVLVGAVASQGTLNADDVILAGSPGMGEEIGHASELDVPANHVWNQEAEGDPIPQVGQIPHAYVYHDWITGLELITPSDEEFGAQQMTTDTEGHSSYWDAHSGTIRNQAAVVTGQYDLVERKPAD